MTPQVATRAVLGIGTATFLANYGLPGGASPASGGPTDDVLAHALAAGVSYVDAAAEYPGSEEAVARVAGRGLRVCTKVVPAATIDDVRRSAGRLPTPVDTILMHSAGSEQLAAAPAVSALRDARAQGLAQRIGASTYGADTAAIALGLDWVDVVQVEYSILNQSVIRSAVRTRPQQEIVVRSVLCKGLLTARRSAAPRLAAQLQDALNGIEACAREWGRSIEELAIRFALDTPGIDVVLVGVGNRAEADTALAAAAAPRLTDREWQTLAAFDRSDVDAAHPERWGVVS